MASTNIGYGRYSQPALLPKMSSEGREKGPPEIIVFRGSCRKNLFNGLRRRLIKPGKGIAHRSHGITIDLLGYPAFHRQGDIRIERGEIIAPGPVGAPGPLDHAAEIFLSDGPIGTVEQPRFSADTALTVVMATGTAMLLHRFVNSPAGVIGEAILIPAVVIGLVCAALTAAGMLLGRLVGAAWGKRVEVLGGVILLAIGVRTVWQHLAA